MWHAVSPVSEAYDPILYESPEVSNLLVLNAGPGNIKLQAWPDAATIHDKPSLAIELHPGDQRVVGGCLIRVMLLSGNFAAIAWQMPWPEVAK
jgi:hypothetical protein